MSAGLSVLPPSPPTTTSRRRAPLAQDFEHNRKTDNSQGVHALRDPPPGTPDESSASFPGSRSGSGKSRKRVEFSPWTNIHNAPIFTTSSPKPVSVRPLLPSRELSSSASILKTTSQLDLTPQGLAGEPQPLVNLIDMLESITQQLSRNEVSESIDAYQTLSSALRAYNDVPDSQVFKSKLGALMQHIRRDLATVEKSEYSPAEINLAIQTLKLLAILAWNRNFSVLLSNEIQGYILDRAIHVLEEHKAPKGVILHYLHLLSTQDFRHSIVTSGGRVGRLLDALKDVTQHFRGNGVVSERLLVYRRILEQAMSHMKANPLSWIHELLDGLTCPNKETRTKAIGLGTKAVAVFTSSSTISHAFRTILDTKLDEGKTVSSFACKRLEKMLASKEDGLVVPQIWAIVLSLMKGIEGGIGKWNKLAMWLKVIQRCFNSSSSDIQSQANIAWNRFVYVISPSEVNESLLGVLIKPIAVQMEQKGMEREDRSSRATAFSAYCNLLYYSFRPSASHKQYDRVWEEYVVKFMTPSLLAKSPAAADRVCRIFMALFWNDSSKSKLWREIRAQENVLMEPEELPTIDCKWIRSKTWSILKIFKLLFQNSSWGSEGQPDQSFVATGWKNFSKALGAACSKEMKPSIETMQALSHTLAFLHDAWKTGPSALNALEDNLKDAFMIRFRFVCMSVLTETGPIPLIEGSLPGNFAEGHMKTDTLRESVPIIHFLGMLSSVNESIIPNQAYYQLVKEVLLLPHKGRIPTRLRIRLLRQSAVSVLVENSETLTETAGSYIWQSIASAVQEEFNSFDNIVKLKPEMDNVLEDVIKTLEIGVTYSPSSTTLWCGLLEILVRFATEGESQDMANISKITHSLVPCIEKAESPRLMTEIAQLIKSAVPYLELFVAKTSSRNLRGKLRKKTMFVVSPLFNKLLFLLNFQLDQAYTALSAESLSGISGITDAACQCLRACPSEVLENCLKELEPSLCLWLHDKHRLLTATTPVGSVKLTAGRKMCTLIIGIFEKALELDSGLAQLGNLLAAGFQSTHKRTINQMIQMWNATFGTKKQLVYPAALRSALERLQPFADLQLPGFSIKAGGVDIADIPAFIDSQDDKTKGGSRFTKFSDSISKETTPIAITTKGTLRHDDSQVEFVAIRSSPLQNMVNESQNLTDRQKEVRARRQAEPAVVFPDLRSSSLPCSDSLDTRRYMNLSMDTKQVDGFEHDGPATPTLPVLPSDGLDEMIASSPTPQYKRPVLRLDDIEVPSSPPSMPGCVEVDTPTELISNHIDVVQNAASDEMTDNRVLPPKFCRSNESPQAQRGSDLSPATEQLLHFDTSEAGRECGDKDLRDIALDGQLQTQGSLLNIVPRNAEVNIPLGCITATGEPDRFIVDTRGENQDQFDTENVEGDTVAESIEMLYNEPSSHTAISSRKEIQPGYVQKTLGYEDNPQEENKNEPCVLGENIRHDAEMAEVLLPYQDDLSRAEVRQHREEDLSLDGNVSNNLAPVHRAPPEKEGFNPAVSSTSSIIGRHSPAMSHRSHADSDEADMLSASQLSQDLNWHVTLERRVSQKERSSEAEVTPPTRKRKRSVGYHSSPKRRKGMSSPLDRASQFLAQPRGTPPEVKKVEDVLDCIIVDTTPRPPKTAKLSSKLSPDVRNAQQGPRKRGRKPKQKSTALPDLHSSPADSSLSSQPEVIVKVKAISVKEESPPVQGAGNVFSKYGQMPSPRIVPTMVRQDDEHVTLGEGTSIESQQTPGTAVMSNNSSVAVMDQRASFAPGKGLEEEVEQTSGPSLLTTCEPIHTHTPSEVQDDGLGPDIVHKVVSMPTPHTHLPPQFIRSQQCPEMQANPRLEANNLDESASIAPRTIEAGGQVEIIGPLQQVLEHLKSARMERLVLREVEDLLFEIRTEAQHAVGRQVAGQ